MLTLRRSEFSETSLDTVHEILDRADYGHLATTDDDGAADVRPMNHARLDDKIYFHGSGQGALQAALHRPVAFSAEDSVAWIPSTWRHPEMACPASTYYRSVVVRGRLETVSDLAEKARVLSAFMDRYQPEGGHRTIAADDPRYRGPLQALTVLALPLRQWTCKVKAGQHLPAEAREPVYRRLLARAEGQDAACARAMRDALFAAPLAADSDGLTWVDDARDVDARAVWGMLSQAYWAVGRPEAVVRRQMTQAMLVLAALDGSDPVAYARVERAPAKGVWIFDVIVREDRRGSRLGTRLMERLLAHPLMVEIPRVFLDTRDAMPFYERLGFRALHVMQRDPNPWESTLMVRVRSATREAV